MEEDCGLLDYKCQLAQTAGSVVGKAIENMSNAVLDAFEKVISSLGTIWVNIGTPNLTGTGSSSSAISPGEAAPDTARQLTLVLGYVTWISLAIAIISLITLGALISIRMRRGEGAAAAGKVGLILGSVVLISAAGALVAGLTPSGPTNVGGAVLFLQSGLWWYMGAAAVLSVIVGGTRMAWEQRADPGRDTVKSLLTLVVVAGAGVTIIGILIAAADAFAVWLINSSLRCDVVNDRCFGLGLANMLALGGPLTGGLGPLLIIILGLVAILASFVQILLMVARGGMLVILAGILPLSASFTNTEMGKQWFRKAISWTVAFILYKPAAAIVYAAAFQLVGSGGSTPGPSALFKDDGSGLLAALTGLMLMVIALFAMPALMRFVTPMVGAMAGGSGGAMAVGALAAVPTGAAAGRLASGSAGGSASPGAAGAQGSSGGGGSTSGGSSGAAPSGGGAGGGGTSAPSTPSGGGAAATSSGAGAAGAGAGTAAGTAGAAGSAGSSAGGGAASAGGGAAAAGAGPAGVAVSAAAQAGQAAAGAAQSIGEQSTSDGGGPDGSS